MLVIKSVITTQAPLSIAMPVADGCLPNKHGQFPIMGRGIDEDGNVLDTGYLPATTLRGFLRRAVVTSSMEKAASNGEHYTLNQAYNELIGQDAASEQSSGDIDLLKLQAEREESPVLDLFGCGFGFKSRLRVSHFMPAVNVLPQVITGVRKDIDDTPAAFNSLSSDDQNAFVNRSENNNKRAEADKLVKSLGKKVKKAAKAGEDTADLEQQLDAATRLMEKYQGEMGDMQNSSRMPVRHHALPAGLELHGKLVIENDRERDIEMIVHALNELSLNPVLGAQAARGCGEVSGRFDFYRDGELFMRVSAGDYMPAEVDLFEADQAVA
jgi:hypothetical protein